MRINFLGATQTVTGSKYLIQTAKINILVDCGLFQGHKELRLRNRSLLPIEPAKIDYVLLTHAHIDHSGYIPLLVKNGFRGKVFCTRATNDLCKILLPDSGYLQEEEARHANFKKYSKHNLAEPLYTKEDAVTALQYFQTIEFDSVFEIYENFYASFHYAGHILGASLIKIECEGKSILFSGDLGRVKDPIMKPPNNPPHADYLVIESTYGNRLHDDSDPEKQLGEIINRTVKRGGIILIPSFAVGRTQSILYYLYHLKKKQVISNIPIFVDSPMATNATTIFSKYPNENRLTPQESLDVCSVAKYIQTTEESMALSKQKMPIIVISASGMATGGRVLHHLRTFVSNYRNTVLFAGFQAGGTRGDRMLNGEKEIKIFGRMIRVEAEVIQMNNLSAHADYIEIIDWLSHVEKAPKKVFITHGTIEAAQHLSLLIEQKYGWESNIPNYLDADSL
ncbi:MAG: MBL fold metallo-hydrolase [Legionellaceae bacterium]|nr:MBL fold metallo-hydrolase [Legionellaceae bacterium]